ncbi:hypothetical protein KR215_007181, partial [Drosophila sulfurigaster]
FGGHWETGMQSAKHQLQQSVGNTLTAEKLQTVVVAVEAVLNSRRRDINPRAPTGWRPTGGTGSVAHPGPGGSELLKAMASCLVAQASVLAAIITGVCAGPAGTGQVTPVVAKSSSRRTCRPRGQPAADAVDGGKSRGGVPRKGWAVRVAD